MCLFLFFVCLFVCLFVFKKWGKGGERRVRREKRNGKGGKESRDFECVRNLNRGKYGFITYKMYRYIDRGEM